DPSANRRRSAALRLDRKHWQCGAKTPVLHSARSCQWLIRENKQRYVPACETVKAKRRAANNRRTQAEIPNWGKFFGNTQSISEVASQRYRPGYKQRAFQAL